MELNLSRGMSWSLSLAYSTKQNYQPVCKGYPDTWRFFHDSTNLAMDVMPNGSWDNIIKAKEECYV